MTDRWLAAGRLAFAAVVVGLGWYSCQPVVRVDPQPSLEGEMQFDPVPVESVRVLTGLHDPNCPSPVHIIARFHVSGRLFGPSDKAVLRLLRRRAGPLGANGVAPTTPSMNDLPVLGAVDKLFADVEADEALRHTEAQAGRAMAVRCGVIWRDPRSRP